MTKTNRSILPSFGKRTRPHHSRPANTPAWSGCRGHDWSLQLLVLGPEHAWYRIVEAGVPEAEDPAISPEQVVALAVQGGRCGHYRSVQAPVFRPEHAWHAAVKSGLPERERAPISREQPVTLAFGQGRCGYDRGLQVAVLGIEHLRDGTQKPGLPERERAPISREQPVPLGVRGRHESAFHRSRQLFVQLRQDAGNRPSEARMPEGEHAPVLRCEPLAVGPVDDGAY